MDASSAPAATPSPVVDTTGAAAPAKVPNCKICCACPQERRLRDECTIFKGHDNCVEQIEGFYQCLLKEGFSSEDVGRLRSNVRKF